MRSSALAIIAACFFLRCTFSISTDGLTGGTSENAGKADASDATMTSAGSDGASTAASDATLGSTMDGTATAMTDGADEGSVDTGPPADGSIADGSIPDSGRTAIFHCGVDAGDGGPIAYWSFDEGDGSALHDCTGNGFNGLLVNGAQWVTGVSGSGMAFPTTPDASTYVSLGTAAALHFSGAFTISAWVNTSKVSASGYIFGEESSNMSTLAFYLSSGSPVLKTLSSTLSPSIASGGPLTPGQWTHIAGVYSPSVEQRVYVNGVQGASPMTVLSGLHDPSGPTMLGGSVTFLNDQLTGSLDEVSIYNRALSASEIAALAQR